jgi:hypothetical protein
MRNSPKRGGVPGREVVLKAGAHHLGDGGDPDDQEEVSCVGAMAASPTVADAFREFVKERVWANITPIAGESAATADIRRSLVASQLLGLAYARYVLRVPPLSTASPPEIGRWAGPTLDRYSSGSLAEPVEPVELVEPA